MHHGDSLDVLASRIRPKSVDLIMTSPPFPLVAKKAYGNPDASEYLDWFRPFGRAFHRVLEPTGSLVLDLGGAWNRGTPTKNLYQYEVMLMLCRELGFHLAQDFFWWHPARLPTPTEWVARRRIRVKDAVNCVWWLSPTPWPKADNRRVLVPYRSADTRKPNGTPRVRVRPSGHRVREHFYRNERGAIPPNLLAIANSTSHSRYLLYCREKGLKPHPARFPSDLPEYFIRMLTDPSDMVLDPFAGSCVTGQVAERLDRRWICVERVEEYLNGGMGRFGGGHSESARPRPHAVPQPGLLWSEESIGGGNRTKRHRSVMSHVSR